MQVCATPPPAVQCHRQCTSMYVCLARRFATCANIFLSYFLTSFLSFLSRRHHRSSFLMKSSPSSKHTNEKTNLFFLQINKMLATNCTLLIVHMFYFAFFKLQYRISTGADKRCHSQCSPHNYFYTEGYLIWCTQSPISGH